MSPLAGLPAAARGTIRYLIAIGMLGLLALKFRDARPFERLATAAPMFVLLALGVLAFDGMARALNWAQLIRAMRVAPRVRYGTVLRIYWAGGFMGQVIPSTVGTDALRAVMAARNIGGHPSAHAAAIVMLNAISLTAGCAGALACSAWLALVGHEKLRLLTMAVYACAIGAAVIGYSLLHWQRGTALRLLRLLPGSLRKLRRGLRRFMHRILVFDRYRINLLPIFAIALVTLLTRAAIFPLVGLAVGLALPFAAWVALVPACTLSGLIPYSVGGFGGDQAAMVYVLTGNGANAGLALSFALIVPLIYMLANMLGGLSLLFGKLDGARPVRNEPVIGGPNG
jgi:uncharacterized protein (TIRG00374 family)